MSLKELKQKWDRGEPVSLEEIKEYFCDSPEKRGASPEEQEDIPAVRGKRHLEKPICKKPDPRRFMARGMHGGGRH